MIPTPLIPTHTAGAAFDRAAMLLGDLSPACPEAAWIGGHLVRALANCVEIPDFVDFDIAVPRSKLAAIEAHIESLGWVREAENGAIDRTPLPHHRWSTSVKVRNHRNPDGVRWPYRVTVDLVIYDDTQGETLPGLVARFDLNVLHLWAVLDSALPKEPPKTPEKRWTISQSTFDYAREHLPAGWGKLHAIHDALYLADPIPLDGPSAYEAIQAHDVRRTVGVWTRPWRLGKYRCALGLGPLDGETLPLIRPPGVSRSDPPPRGFQWVEYADLQSWRNHGPCRAPWLLGDLESYHDAQGLHDRAVAYGVAVPDVYQEDGTWSVWESADNLRTGVAAISIRNAYVVEVHPGNPEAPQPGQYVRVWDGEIRQTDPSNPVIVRMVRFPPDVFDRIVALRDTETKS